MIVLFVLSVTYKFLKFTECRYAEYRCAECHGANRLNV
jgi:hypothetical protein